MRATSFRSRVTYTWRTEASCLSSAAASAVAIAAVRAWVKREDTGLARSPVTENLLSRAAEDATSTKEGVTCLFPVTTVTSPRSELEAKDELKRNHNESNDLSPSRRPPRPPPELRAPPRLPRPNVERRPEPPPPPGVPTRPPPPLSLSRRWWESPPPPLPLPSPPWPPPPTGPPTLEPPPQRRWYNRWRLSPRRVLDRWSSSCSSCVVGHNTGAWASSWANLKAVTRSRVGVTLS